MVKINVKNALLATSAICAIGVFANNAKAEVNIDSIITNLAPHSISNIQKMTTTPDTCDATNNCFKVGDSYYSYEVPEGEDYYENSEHIQSYITGGIVSDKRFIGLKISKDFPPSPPSGAAIYLLNSAENITADFINNWVEGLNTSSGNGGAVYLNHSIISDGIYGDFIGNYAKANSAYAYGGAIYNTYQGSYSSATIIGNFVGNHTESKTGSAKGGAVYKQCEIIISGNFIDNYAYSDSGTAQGGAIYNSYNLLEIQADAHDSLFYGNYIQAGEEEKQYEAIYNDDSAILTFTSKNGGSYTFYDYINGNGAATINFVSDDKEEATFNLYNDIKGQGNINFKNKYILNMISPSDIHKDVPTSQFSYIQAKNITISAAIQMAVDVDLVNLEMDRFVADNFTIDGGNGGSLYIKEFWIANENEESDIGQPVNVQFIDATTTAGLNLITSVAEAVGDVYAYSVEYNNDGTFTFTKTGLKPEPQPEPVGPSEEETTASTANAAVEGVTHAVVEALAGQVLNRDVATMSGLNSGDAETLSTWVEVFGSNDDVELKHLSSAIDTQFYGVVGGVDSKRFAYDNGINAVYGVYGAYTNGRQKYDGNKITQKGGYLGVSAAFRKDALFNNVTLNGGYLKNEANTKFGKDKFDTKVVSLANKTGVDLKKDAWTFTPALTLGYMGIDTEDYTTKSGVKVDNKFMNVFTVAPELKVTKDFGEGLNGYSKVAYKMFFYDNAKVKVDSVLLPNMSVKPYVEYGVGLKKDWSQTEWNAHDVSTFAEITRHDGGREGWDVNLGLKLDF